MLHAVFTTMCHKITFSFKCQKVDILLSFYDFVRKMAFKISMDGDFIGILDTNSSFFKPWTRIRNLSTIPFFLLQNSIEFGKSLGKEDEGP